MAAFLASLLSVGQMVGTAAMEAAKGVGQVALDQVKDVGPFATEAAKEVGQFATDTSGAVTKNPISMAMETPKNEGGFVQFIKEDSPLKDMLMRNVFSAKEPSYPKIKGPTKQFTKFGYSGGPSLSPGGANLTPKDWDSYQQFLKDYRDATSRNIAEKEFLRKQKIKDDASQYIAPMSYNDIIANYPYVSDDVYSPYYTPPSIDDLDREEEEYWQQIPPWSDIMKLSREG